MQDPCCRLSMCGTQASLPHGMWDLSSPIRDQVTVPYIGRWILNHWTTREVQISFLPPHFFFKKLLILFLAVLSLHCFEGFFPVAMSGSSSLAAVRGLLIAVASLVAEHRPQGPRASVVAAHGSVVVTHGLSYSAARGIFRDEGSNLCLLHWRADSLPLSQQGSPPFLS